MINRRLIVLMLFVLCVAVLLAFGVQDYLRLDAVKREASSLTRMWERNPLLFSSSFILLNIAALILLLPGAVLGFSLAAGAIFGAFWGTVIALTAIVAGDSLSFLLARYVVRDWVEAKLGQQAERANAGVKRDGAFYLLALRLMAVVPYFVVNLTMGLTRLPLRLFAPVSLLGLSPVIFLYVQAGTQLPKIEGVSDIYTPRMLVTLALIGILPLAMRYALRSWSKRNPI